MLPELGVGVSQVQRCPLLCCIGELAQGKGHPVHLLVALWTRPVNRKQCHFTVCDFSYYCGLFFLTFLAFWLWCILYHTFKTVYHERNLYRILRSMLESNVWWPTSLICGALSEIASRQLHETFTSWPSTSGYELEWWGWASARVRVGSMIHKSVYITKP